MENNRDGWRENIASSELARRTAADFDQFRRDAYEYRREAEERLSGSLDKLRHETMVTMRWAIGLALLIIVAVSAGVFSKLETLSHLEDAIITIKEHNSWQDKAIELLNDRLRTLEMNVHQSGSMQ
jgi:hypothetical protein